MNDINKKIRVMVLGLRGFPDVIGGVEKHCEHLYPLLTRLGCDVLVLARSRYVMRARGERLWKGVRVRATWAPKAKRLEALVHTLIGVIRAGIARPDILHIHGIGPAIVVPIARLFGLRVVVTHHSVNYMHEKWGVLARTIFRLGERWGMRYAQGRISVSQPIAELVKQRYGCDTTVIPNGIDAPEKPLSMVCLHELGLDQKHYVLLVGRIAQEKRQLDMIRAFAEARLLDWKLVLVGAPVHADDYSRQVASLAELTPRVVVAGYRTGRDLRELYSNAGVFVLPSSNEGNPIALLEALSYGLPVIASDIPANRELALPTKQYFPVGDIVQLAARLRRCATGDFDRDGQRLQSLRLMERRTWERVTKETLAVYEKVLEESVQQERKE